MAAAHTSIKGRAPWYDDSTGSVKKPLMIGVSGGSTSGKSHLCEEIVRGLNLKWAVRLSGDSFYKDVAPGTDLATYNWDHPDAFDFDDMYETLLHLQAGRSVSVKEGPKMPSQSAEDRSRGTQKIYGADIVLVNGTLLFYDERVSALFDIKIFVDCDADTRLIRRLRRDVFQRGLPYQEVLQKYDRFVKPGYEDYVLPTKRHAHLIVPLGPENGVAVDLITRHVKYMMMERDLWKPDLAESCTAAGEIPACVTVLPQTQSVRAMHTILRNRDTSQEDFIFYTERLSRLLVELALSALVDAPRNVETPTGALYRGVALDYENLCAVSIMRAGEAMESAVRNVVCDVRIGKLLIQSVEKAPRLFYCSLDSAVRPGVRCLLLDGTLATGQCAKMAVRVLKDHGVEEGNIVFLCLVASRQGVLALHQTYPLVRVFAGAVDEHLDDNFYISPGIGNFGDRYFL